MANKYFAKRIKTNYGAFDSMGEYRLFIELNARKKAESESERVTEIERQVTYQLKVNDVLIGRYIADFRVTFADGRVEVYDFKNPYLVTGKGKNTPAGQIFNYKRKLMKAIYNVDILVRQ